MSNSWGLNCADDVAGVRADSTIQHTSAHQCAQHVGAFVPQQRGCG